METCVSSEFGGKGGHGGLCLFGMVVQPLQMIRQDIERLERTLRDDCCVEMTH